MKNKNKDTNALVGLAGTVCILAVATQLNLNAIINMNYIKSLKQIPLKEYVRQEDKYTRKKAYVNNDSIKDYNIYKNGILEETWYGIKSSENSNAIYMTKEEINNRINLGEKWGLKPKVDTSLMNFKNRTGIY